MPYTFAHIGFTLPVYKRFHRYFSVTGLVFGSIVPDFDILFRLTKVRYHIFEYDLKTILFIICPIGLIFALFFHLFCRNVIIEQLPESLHNKYKRYLTVDFIKIFKRDYIRIAASVILAILLHILLDYISHVVDAHSVKLFLYGFIRSTAVIQISYILAIYGFPVLFSLLGFYLLYKNVLDSKLVLHIRELKKKQLTFLGLLLINTLLFIAAKTLITEIDMEFLIDYIAISITSSFLLSLYLTCILYRIFQKKPIYE